MQLGRGILVACALVCAQPGHAETLLETYRAALTADPRLAAAQLDYEASGRSRRAALSGLLPTVSADAEYTQERQNILSSQNAVIGAGLSNFPIDQWSLTITQPLFKLGAFQRLQQAEAAEKQAYTQRVAAEQNLMVRVASAYIGVLAAQDNLDFARAERTAIGRQLELAQERVTRGLATVVNLNDAQARYAYTEAQEVEARNTLDDAQQAMREILGKLPRGYMALREQIPVSEPDPANVAKWVELATQRNLSLEARRLGAEVAYQEIQKQRAGYAPTVNLVGSQVNRKQGGTLFGGGSHVETTDISVRLNIPIYEGGLTTALTDEAIARHRKSLEEVEAETRAVDRQTRAAYLGVVGAISRVRALQQGVTAQESALKGKQESYRAGILTLINVLDAERDLYLARRDHARARYDYLINGLKLKQAIGSLAETDLESIDRLLR